MRTGGGGTRFWAPEDARLVHELLQSNLKSRLTIDHDRVVFSGGSQGTCFLAQFVEYYGGSYGGGFHAHCGCFWLDFDGDDSHDTRWDKPPFLASPWRPTFQWTPHAASAVSERFRVFVEATTEDFLHPAAVSMSKYYSEWLGIETRTDLEAAGGHCHTGRTPHREIIAWLSSADVPERSGSDTDADGDGVPDESDLDDDNDGAPDFIDALPRDGSDWRDTDRDGIPDSRDGDADGDGVANADDAFPLDVREASDSDEDGIGNNLDDADSRGLDFVSLNRPFLGYEADLSGARTQVHPGAPSTVRYPAARGHWQSYQFLELGNGPNGRFEIMVDVFLRPESCPAVLLPQLCDVERFAWDNYYSSYFQDQFFRVWIDRNRNADLTDDGPALLMATVPELYSNHTVVTTTEAVLEVPYRRGRVLPYAIVVRATPDTLSGGLWYRGSSVWSGEVEAPSGRPVRAIVVDGNHDGVFDSRSRTIDGERDFVCLDLDRNDLLNECDFSETAGFSRTGSVLPSEPFDWGEGRYEVVVAPWGSDIMVVEFTPGPLGPPRFGPSSSVLEQRWQEGVVIEPLVLPVASGGEGWITYTLSPEPPAGVAFDDSSRTLSGRPMTVSGPTEYTYTATDAAGVTASLSFVIEVVEAEGNCRSSSDAMCLQGSRYEVTVDWWTADGQAGTAQVADVGTADSGLFWFFNSTNWELLIKVLDGCGVNGHHWVFGAATTDVGYEVRVVDTESESVREYRNEPGQAGKAIADVTAFPEACAATGAAAAGRERPARDAPGLLGSRQAASPNLVLQNGRFDVRIEWTSEDGDSGPGFAAPERTVDSGLFWFFEPSNWEMLVKVLDGCALNDHYWVLAGSATTLGFEIAVTNTRDGSVRRYAKTDRRARAAALVDSAAFPCSGLRQGGD